jgi:hypothetical protein
MNSALNRRAEFATGNAGRSLNVCVVSAESRAALGGLPAYCRYLSRALAADGAEVGCVSRVDRDMPAWLSYGDGSNGIEHLAKQRVARNRLVHVWCRNQTIGNRNDRLAIGWKDGQQ